MAVNVLLIDDHPFLREGLKGLLGEGVVSDEAGSCAAAIALKADRVYDLILLDLNLPDVSGVRAVEKIRAEFPETPVVVVSAENDPAKIRAAIDAGAMGFVPKSSNKSVLEPALRLVLAGDVYLPRELLNDSVPTAAVPSGDSNEPNAILEKLTQRQKDVLKLVMQGKSNKGAANKLGISANTVKSHLGVIMQILGASTRTEAVYLAAKLNLRRLV